jgi:hypothetical protein
MRSIGVVARQRVLPAVLTAAGVTMIAAGLLQYGAPASAEPGPAGRSPTPSATASDDPVGYVPPSLPPIGASPSARPSPSTDPHRIATRVVVASLGIDLPIIAQPNPAYPSCNVAMYYQDPRLGQPGGDRSIYLYAHARIGMFYPLYERATLGRHGGQHSLLGLRVDVYTSDDQVYHYQITEVRPRVKADNHFLDGPLAVTSETLWLQTSTGPGGQYPKLQVVAEPVFVEGATHAQAHPKAHPVNCA